jgi:hypothetical protein
MVESILFDTLIKTIQENGFLVVIVAMAGVLLLKWLDIAKNSQRTNAELSAQLLSLLGKVTATMQESLDKLNTNLEKFMLTVNPKDTKESLAEINNKLDNLTELVRTLADKAEEPPKDNPKESPPAPQEGS